MRSAHGFEHEKTILEETGGSIVAAHWSEMTSQIEGHPQQKQHTSRYERKTSNRPPFCASISDFVPSEGTDEKVKLYAFIWITTHQCLRS